MIIPLITTYFLTGILLVIIIRQFTVDPPHTASWWADDRKRRAILFATLFAYPLLAIGLTVWYVPQWLKNLLWDA